MKKVSSLLTAGRTVIAAVAMVVGLAVPQAAWACAAKVGDFVWLDGNGNGVQDAGEAGIPNVRVTLHSLDGTLLKSVLTDGSGYYSFDNYGDRSFPPQCENTYIIRAETPAGLVATLIGAGGDVARDSNDPAGALVTPTDPDGDSRAEDLTIDFGFVAPRQVCTGKIGDVVWYDVNNNGRQDAGESGFNANVVTLSGSSSSTMATNASGLYLFSDLCAGTYTVCADVPSNFQPSPTNAAGVPVTLDSNGISNGSGQSCATVTLPTDSSEDVTIDFGFSVKPVSSPGTGTPGYWKNHPEAWPVDAITIGGVVYTKAQAIALMESGDGDKTLTVFRALVAAKLNVLIGNDSSCISSTISAADAWMASYGPAGSRVTAKSVAWKNGEPLYWALDAYNNGDKCAPHRQ